ncbi:hypothetical protein P2318_00640 [Myxococcaceae bacterium GXIMD 01537]
MMTSQAVREQVLSSNTRGPGFDELRGLLSAGTRVEDIAHGHLLVGEARATYALRQRTAAAARIPVKGIGELVTELATLEEGTVVSLFHFGALGRVFTVVVHEPSTRMVGCIAAPRGEAPMSESKP